MGRPALTGRSSIKSFAKINLFLDVICRRRDGYHNIETVFQSVSLCDTIEIELARSGTTLSCNHPAVPSDESNLALKAFLRLKEAAGYDGGVRMEIKKNIPPGSGLGGGSSNAAAALVASNHLLKAGLSEQELLTIASRLGADVPFFLSGGLAAGWQIGDRLRPLPPVPESPLVVVVPRNLAVSTAEVYGTLNAPQCKAPDPENFDDCSDRLKDRVAALSRRVGLAEIASSGSVLYNALEEPVIARHPEIGEIKKMLLEAGAQSAMMSGSGSAVFAPAESTDHAHEIKSALEGSFACDCFVAQTNTYGWEWEGSSPSP